MNEIPASEFDYHDFDARELVQRYRKRVPLPQLQKGLRGHHEATRQELVELINEKYVDFVSLSSRMQGVERALKPLWAPLKDSADLTQGLRSKLGALLEQAEQTQQSLAEVRGRKESLTAYIENAKLLDKAKMAAGQRWGNPRESDDFLREYVAQENIARDLRRIRLNLGGKLHKCTGDPLGTSTSLIPPQADNDVSDKRTPDNAKGSVASPLPHQEGGGDILPECQGLLLEATEFEKAFAKRLADRLRGLVAALGRHWDTPRLPAAGPASQEASEFRFTGLPPRAELLALAHLARALVTIGRAGVVENIFAEVFAKSALDAAVTGCSRAAEEAQRHAAESGGGNAAVGVGVGAVNLRPFFDSMRSQLLSEAGPFLWLVQRLRGAPVEDAAQSPGTIGGIDGSSDSALLAVPGLHLVANAAIGPTLQRVQKVWPNIFMPAFPDVFAANYAHAANFMRDAEKLMTAAELNTFIQGTHRNDFQRRWKTQVYSSLRTKEAVQSFEVAAAKSRTETSDGGTAMAQKSYVVAGCGYWFEVSAGLVRILETVWSDQWSLDALYPKSLQLSLELLARYGSCMRTLAAPQSSADAPASSGWDATATPPTWTSTSQPVRLARASADVLSVMAEVGGDADSAGGTDREGRLLGLILERLPRGPRHGGNAARPRELVRVLVKEACDGLRPALAELETALLQQVTAVTAAQFAAIRGIPAFYRMLNKPVPTRASPYVESAVRPLQALQELALQVAPAGAVAGWVQRATDGAATEFSSQAANLLESTHQQEASLRRLAGRGSGNDSQVTDLEKIHIQLCLDVETFIAAVAAFGGGTAASNLGLSKLAEVIVPVRHTFEAHRPAAS